MLKKLLCILRKLMPFCFGAFCIYSSFSFIFDLETFNGIFVKLKTPYFLQAFLVIAISGIGLELGFKYILHFKEELYLLWITVLFSISMLIFQIVMTIAVNSSGCSCQTRMEIIESISDWHRVENAVILLVLAVASTIVLSKVKLKKRHLNEHLSLK